ncbi:hypothetical protein, partial [Archangium sp.]|uniref:hypothetical protein n=1 Tax=Archangium sp. TaxID=1872627 RepID=UPI002D62DEAB
MKAIRYMLVIMGLAVLGVAAMMLAGGDEPEAPAREAAAPVPAPPPKPEPAPAPPPAARAQAPAAQPPE